MSIIHTYIHTYRYENIVLRNVTVMNPKGSAGVIFANDTTPMRNIVFDDVKVINPGTKPFGPGYFCKGVASGVATGNTTPVPPCFTDLTTGTLAGARAAASM